MPIVNSWTEWGNLKEICIGRADNACFAPLEANIRKPTINNAILEEYFVWPEGRKKKEIIDRANNQLEMLADIMEGEGVVVHRPTPVDHYVETTTPSWSSRVQYGTACPRDIMITLGDIILEANMSKRSRLFEYLPYRKIIRDIWKRDKQMQWKSMPKSSLDDDCFDLTFWTRKREKNVFEYTLTEKEPILEAADIIRCGKDIFVQKSLATNDSGIEWLTRELGDKVRVHTMRFPDNLYPQHIDATFLPLRPGLALTNPERQPDSESAKIWKENDWKFMVAPSPSSDIVPPFCCCSKWLAMNVLSLSESKVIVEENEKQLQNMLEDNGFDVITVPFRHVYEFGGGLHCATWDIRRDDSCRDYFPNQ